jgi:hypothetical protein
MMDLIDTLSVKGMMIVRVGRMKNIEVQVVELHPFLPTPLESVQ